MPKGKTPDDVIVLPSLNAMAKERTGYPTQKPLELLYRIINAGSNEGDVILDPFCGCATTMVAAEQLNRQWVGIDISSVAIHLVDDRMKEETNLFDKYKPNFERDPPKRTDGGTPMQDVFTDSGIDDCTTEEKKTLYMQQKGICNGCKDFKRARYFEVDHIKPKAKGGDDDIKNLQLLCITCHPMKGTGTMEELEKNLKEKKMMRPTA